MHIQCTLQDLIYCGGCTLGDKGDETIAENTPTGGHIGDFNLQNWISWQIWCNSRNCPLRLLGGLGNFFYGKRVVKIKWHDPFRDAIHTHRGRHLTHYIIMGISLPYDLRYHLTLYTVNNSYRFWSRPEPKGTIIAYYIYRSDVIDKCYHIYLLSYLGKNVFKSKYNMILFYFSRQKYTQNSRKS
jgi:hypothetical protein